MTPQTLYKFAHFALLYQEKGQTMSAAALDYVTKQIEDISKTYLNEFKPIVINQLKKYIAKGRIDYHYDFKGLYDTSINYDTIAEYMKHTYRSDLTTRNTRWEELTDFLAKLSKAYKIEDLIHLIDRINNTTHNVRLNNDQYESILAKFENGRELLKAYDDIHAIDPKSLGVKAGYAVEAGCMFNAAYDKILKECGLSHVYKAQEQA